jgi:NAD(P)-dependent dehydrogenase (short-subunit alcohol dehydrogenase family)
VDVTSRADAKAAVQAAVGRIDVLVNNAASFYAGYFGRVQREGGPVEEIRPGDVVWFSPGEKHKHGASPTTAMTHIAIQEKKDGKVVDWMEQVPEKQYHKENWARN